MRDSWRGCSPIQVSRVEILKRKEGGGYMHIILKLGIVSRIIYLLNKQIQLVKALRTRERSKNC